MLVATRHLPSARRVAMNRPLARVIPGSSFPGLHSGSIGRTRCGFNGVVMAAYNLETFKDFSLLLSQWCTVATGFLMLKNGLFLGWLMFNKDALAELQTQARPKCKSFKDRCSEALSVVLYQTTLFCVFFFVLPRIALFYDADWDPDGVGSMILDAVTSQALALAFPQTWGLELSDQVWNTLTKMAQATSSKVEDMVKGMVNMYENTVIYMRKRNVGKGNTDKMGNVLDAGDSEPAAKDASAAE